MPTIVSVAEAVPPYEIDQETAIQFAKQLFSGSFRDIDRLLQVFQNGQIEKSHFIKGIDWFRQKHGLAEKNKAYIEGAVQLGTEAIQKCLGEKAYIKTRVPYDEIDAIFTISSSGIATPSIEARIMNILPFKESVKRIPIWGLGCAGGAAGLSRAYEFCLAFPKAKVLVLCIELCSLTFQHNDRTKSNLIGTSLFADGVACALLCGDEAFDDKHFQQILYPKILATESITKRDSLNVMGWDVKDEGLYVVFSKSIPTIITNWLKPNVDSFLQKNNLQMKQMNHFIVHPGGKKILEAYVHALNIPQEMVNISFNILRQYGNMSSATILYVLNRFMRLNHKEGEYGLALSLGPGFSSESLLLRWGR
ncbi:type III polyketide synthase [Bacillus aquiflavi]|uniref:type III polyketide synthase n=1 Tax=Bacillus aquiflavi TaxID=2672567 RepID=UPI001CA7CA3C|nr:3-oxoacyl-[acyl-carrier-protein] synthase III C-terminal domain-containing protein [Bacillus aquiflavi]UAC47019.1 type III polyketide synthase [Bacillus aquiflavi]